MVNCSIFFYLNKILRENVKLSFLCENYEWLSASLINLNIKSVSVRKISIWDSCFIKILLSMINAGKYLYFFYILMMWTDEFMIVLKNMRMILLFVYINIYLTSDYWNFFITLFFNIFIWLRMRMLIVCTNLDIIEMFF